MDKVTAPLGQLNTDKVRLVASAAAPRPSQNSPRLQPRSQLDSPARRSLADDSLELRTTVALRKPVLLSIPLTKEHGRITRAQEGLP